MQLHMGIQHRTIEMMAFVKVYWGVMMDIGSSLWVNALIRFSSPRMLNASSATYRSGIGTVLPVAAASKGLSLHRSG